MRSELNLVITPKLMLDDYPNDFCLLDLKCVLIVRIIGFSIFFIIWPMFDIISGCLDGADIILMTD